MFRTQRKKRLKRLRKVIPKQWDTLPDFLILPHEHFQHRIECGGERVQLKGLMLSEKAKADPGFSETAFNIWIKEAGRREGFADSLDRHLGLPTSEERREYDNYWATKRNKVYVYFAFLAFIISVGSLIVSVVALQKSGSVAHRESGDGKVTEPVGASTASPP